MASRRPGWSSHEGCPDRAAITSRRTLFNDLVILDRIRADLGEMHCCAGCLDEYVHRGARLVGHTLLKGKRKKAKYGVATVCVGGGMGAAGLFEIY